MPALRHVSSASSIAAPVAQLRKHLGLALLLRMVNWKSFMTTLAAPDDDVHRSPPRVARSEEPIPC